MFAKKLGRVARLVLVLAVAFGGVVGVAAAGGADEANNGATTLTTLVVDWE